ncbi:hypothetical protein FJTKL_03694 [Diaporthe vaccinii]|uniref:Uncharacterized protein n=1 Tax=Diaporthe vaccinii TaxID=105482 RepID=A0ABR4DVV3_9PEZI
MPALGSAQFVPRNSVAINDRLCGDFVWMMANVSVLQRIHAVCVGPMTPERLPVVVITSSHALAPLPSSLGPLSAARRWLFAFRSP